MDFSLVECVQRSNFTPGLSRRCNWEGGIEGGVSGVSGGNQTVPYNTTHYYPHLSHLLSCSFWENISIFRFWMDLGLSADLHLKIYIWSLDSGFWSLGLCISWQILPTDHLLNNDKMELKQDNPAWGGSHVETDGPAMDHWSWVAIKRLASENKLELARTDLKWIWERLILTYLSFWAAHKSGRRKGHGERAKVP